MAFNEKSLLNLNRSGKAKGTKSTKFKFDEVITEDKMTNLINGLYDIAINDKWAKNRIAASTYLIDRGLGKMPQTINNIGSEQTINDILADDNDNEE